MGFFSEEEKKVTKVEKEVITPDTQVGEALPVDAPKEKVVECKCEEPKEIQIKQLDRISYSFGLKVNLGNYESADAHFSLSRDVPLGTEPEDTLAELQAFIEEKARAKYSELKGDTPATPPPAVASKPATQTKASPATAPKAQAKSGGGGDDANLAWFKIKPGEPVIMMIIDDFGTYTTKYGDTHGYKVEIDGTQYKYSTGSATITNTFEVGKEFTIEMCKDGAKTFYKIA